MMNEKAGWNLDNSYARLPELFFSVIEPNPVRSPQLVILNQPLAKALGLDPEALQAGEGIDVFAGNRVPEGSLPLAQAYAGHQFGNFTRLGDGRALLVGEQLTPGGERFDIQLKGSGRTPYSRGGDGRAALGPMLREYIISEAMHGLRIPTTRSLAVVTTGEPVYRETELTGAVMTRVASSHLRVGTFEYAYHWGTTEDIKALADYALERHYPDVEKKENRYLTLLEEVIKRQAKLIAQWQLVGFIHGVMNTDNMTISGETIDYGPCAFMDAFSSDTVFSSIDIQGRYAYGNQPPIAVWNLSRFAESLLPLLHEEQDKAIELAEKTLSQFKDLFQNHWQSGMKAKLGWFGAEEQDEALISELLHLMEKHRADYTNTFLALTFDRDEKNALFEDEEFARWRERWQARREKHAGSSADSVQLMKDSNPAVIPRNHRVEEALEAAVSKGDYSVMEKLLDVLSNPYAHTAEQAGYSSPPPDDGQCYKTYCGT
ncbi:protein adenylyltransferase SelO [Fictibacillus terranigra]|uniref:Protein nucleotidyltransferase YdiU n=1 Tax=Fictibacillus terranigra TaxID=3058424 RepID=A0ABT8E1F4_9BACL|nr:YdiU family protein [Fictibacillus sp. CENA-BCM004]MDN4071750.1 YdiU family protein [Fictibacillus sp. CENA-BCM004]